MGTGGAVIRSAAAGGSRCALSGRCLLVHWGSMTRPRVEIVLPDVGAAPVVLSAWFADPGDEVYEGDRLVEVLVGGATFDVSSPATGRLAEKRALTNDRLRPGQVLGFVESD